MFTHWMPAQWRRRSIASLITLLTLTLLLALIIAPIPSHADSSSLTPSTEKERISFIYNEGIFYQGLVGTDAEGKHYYCIEAGKRVDHSIGQSTTIKDSEAARRLAWILSQYHDVDAKTHAAISILVQDQFGKMQNDWDNHRVALEEQHSDVVEKAQEIWDESDGKVPGDAQVTFTENQSSNRGVVEVLVTDYDNNPLPGVKFTVTLIGPARFIQNGETTFSGVSGVESQPLMWEASGEGEIKADIAYEHGQVLEMDSAQDLLALADVSMKGGTSATFDVGSRFRPSLSTEAMPKVVDAGSPIVDEVTSGLEGGEWEPGLKLYASGYYFDGLSAGDLVGEIAPSDGESADAFLGRLAAEGYVPAAYGDAFFDGPNQTVQAQAVTEFGGSELYKGAQESGFGTWVWAFESAKQDEDAKPYLIEDWVSGFLTASETNIIRRQVKVSSEVAENSVEVGAALSDTIVVSGFPEGHGSFTGNEDYEFGADEPYAQVSVWWAGDSDNPANNEAYEPSGPTVPNEDEHHRKVAQWRLPAANGTYVVGTGLLDADGKKMSVRAEEHGWYVFVWSFAGDDRVQAVSSRYDDPLERVRVMELGPESEDEETEETVQKTVAGPKQLGKTGSGVLLVTGIGVAVLSVGAIMLAAVKRRSL